MQWATKYESLTHDWRRNVVDKFHLLLDEVSEELQDLVANGKAFQFTLAHARTVEDAHMASQVRRELINEQTELDRAANVSATARNPLHFQHKGLHALEALVYTKYFFLFRADCMVPVSHCVCDSSAV